MYSGKVHPSNIVNGATVFKTQFQLKRMHMQSTEIKVRSMKIVQALTTTAAANIVTTTKC
jgi:hypothetical protein